MNNLLTIIISFIKTNLMDEEMLGLRLEELARKAAAPIAVVFTAGIIAREVCQSFLKRIEPQTPTFTTEL
jgi:hypothetical protein